MTNSAWVSVIGLAVSLLCTGCDTGAGAAATEADTPSRSAAPATAPPVLPRLPVSYNEVMVALVNEAADPIWVAAWHNPGSDAQWRALERRALQLKLAGALLSVPGTGPLDDDWAAEPKWQRWTEELTGAGNDALAAVKSRRLDDIRAAGDRIVQACEGCHVDFKLAAPTGAMYGELSPNAADMAEDGS